VHHRLRRSTRIRTASLIVLCFGALGLLGAPGVRAEDDPVEERDRVREEAAAVAGRLDVLRADDAEVQAAIAALDDQIAAQEAEIADLQANLDRATADLAAAEADEDRAVARITGLEANLAEFAVSSYVGAGTNRGGDPLTAILGATDAQQAAERRAFSDFTAARGSDLLDEMDGAREELTLAREAAQEQQRYIAASQLEAGALLEELEQTQADKEAFQQELALRIESALGEAANLQELDAELSAEILERQQAIIAMANLAGGGVSGPVPVPGDIPLATVGGITVYAGIADQLGSLLNAASADGVQLSGSGYRDPQRQIELRRQNCGSSSYAIYQASPGSCSPPTARPGTSNHERGLAIDFRNCSTRGTACYQWLAGHAASYGFYNLPSEAWHWSTNGR
jgi:LAS superfamily LD-carboxypeptidase LdcB